MPWIQADSHQEDPGKFAPSGPPLSGALQAQLHSSELNVQAEQA